MHLDVATIFFFENAVSLTRHTSQRRETRRLFCKMRVRVRKLTSESLLVSTRNEIRAATRTLYHKKVRERERERGKERK